jgi:lipopolysaccharide biosynthesis glycosyltransferase
MIYSAMLYKSAATDFNIVICVPQSSGDRERGPFLEGEGLSAEGKTLVAEFCNIIGVSFSFEELRTEEPIFYSEEFKKNFAVFDQVPYSSLIARLIMFINAKKDFIYLDVDLIMQPGWDEILTEYPKEKNTVLMAAKNHYRVHLKERDNPEHPEYWVMENSTNSDNYFNSGVMKYFYENWKSQNFTIKLLQLLKRIEDGELKVWLPDQDVLNSISRDHVEILDQEYNVMVHSDAGDITNEYFSIDKHRWPRILHFVGGTKPNAFDEEFKNRVIRMIDWNSSNKFHDHAQNFFYIYFFIHNQRLLWEGFHNLE